MHSAAGGSGGLGLVDFISAVPTVGWIQGDGVVVVHNRSAAVHVNLSLVAGWRVEWGEGYKGAVNSEYIYSYNMAQQCPKVHRMLYGRLYSIYVHTYVLTNEVQPKLTCIACTCSRTLHYNIHT